VPKELNIQTVVYNKTNQGKCAVSILKTSTYYSKIDTVLDVHSGQTIMNGTNRSLRHSIVECTFPHNNCTGIYISRQIRKIGENVVKLAVELLDIDRCQQQ
jgi:hypothetical protein